MSTKISNSFYYLLKLVIVSLSFLKSGYINGQMMNRAPYFVPGGDMARFSLSENTAIGSPVYQLRGIDPEGSLLHYSISGPMFTVDRETGVIRLQKELDREQQDLIEVIISITDEGVLDTEPNTVSLRREIPIRDYNDNPPVFIGRPYSASISETSAVGSLVEVMPTIFVTDKDEGRNSDVYLSCFSDKKYENDDICDVFLVSTEKISEGNFSSTITLTKQLDFETRPSYVLTIQAKDGANENVLSAFATIAINVIDVQDQQPVFANAPYSATLQENTLAGTSVLMVRAADGDTENPNPIHLTIEDDIGGHFKLLLGPNGMANLVTTAIPLDRENPNILASGGVYTFNVRATELINNELPGDSTTTQITIVVTDVNDHIPEFNAAEFNISIAENLEQDTPLPGLSLYVYDKDLGMNSRYNLSLENIHNSENVFAVSPLYGEGRSAIVIKVIDSSKLDFDVADESLTRFSFHIVASVNGTALSKSRINIQLDDANDNSPVFEISSYHLRVKENSPIGHPIEVISATDADTDGYGKLKYYIKGFGSEFFATNINDGGVFVKRNLDYEEQKSYSLTLVAIDGGGRENNTNLYITIEDENDNHPQFESLEYTRTIREAATQFEPQFFVRAFDVDGPEQGGGKIKYAIEHENSISGHVFSINSETGEVKMTHSVSSMDTERGQYELVISATDYGTPPLKNDTRVLIRVGISGNQRPIFKGHFSSLINGAIPGPPSYRVSIPENAPEGFLVTTVQASDPDGIDSLLEYRIVGSNDNFLLNERTGQITVSADARLDRDLNPHSYDIAINAVDAGFPIPETATTTVHVNIVDVNDKPPKFNLPSYVAYVSEITPIGTEIITVSARDTDLTANLHYTIIEPIKAASKAGLQLTSTKQYNYKTAVKIDESTGTVTVNQTLNYDLTSVITLTIKVEDLNATYNKEQQFDNTELTLYIQSFKDTNPIFKNKGWTYFKPNISAKVKEEQPIGSIVFSLVAEDPVEETAISRYEMIEPDSTGFFGLNEQTGDIILKKRLDYEALNATNVLCAVLALSANGKRQSKVFLNFTILNVNDNIPIFDKKMYRVTIVESSKYPTIITTVSAKDDDKSLTKYDETIGYNKVSYLLSGVYASLFTIDNRTGEIKIAKNQVLDREKQSVIKLIVIAEDSPGKPSDSRKSTTEVLIDILDVNDNAPIFDKILYTAVISENSGVDSFVVKTTATDPDEGPGGEIRYDFLNEGEAMGLLSINMKTGEVRTKVPLTGKGRSDPYELIVRAQDNGGQVSKQTTLFNDVTFVLYIGDSNTNDGIPVFFAPKIGHIANVTENATIGSPVYQVIASDPDSPSSPSGTLRYRIQEDIVDAKSFRIDANTGLVTTLVPLDRETKDSYKIIVEVADKGEPPQAATRVLRINVLDIDDHQPEFQREISDQPIEMLVLEEQPIGAIVGNISATDFDIGENGAIDYVFIDGNEQDMFKIVRMDSNSAIIMTAQRLDRETMDSHLLTIKCFKYGDERNSPDRKAFYRYDKAEIQVLIKIVDIDDHLPEFSKNDKTIGIKHNLPIDTSILTVEAKDDDVDALPIVFTIENVTFVPQFYRRHNESFKNLNLIFSMNNKTGEIRTKKSLSEFVDGYFEMIVRANNSKSLTRFTDNPLKIFIIRDKSLMRFVFAKPPIEVNIIIDEFTDHIQSELKAYDLELNVFAAHVLSKPDHSLDFSSTSSCFQLSRHGAALSPHEMEKLINSEEIKMKLLNTYLHYSVQQVDSCAVSKNILAASSIVSSGTWLVVLAAFIGLGALIVTLTACCLFKKYHKQMTIQNMPPRVVPSNIYESANGPILYSEPNYGPL